MPMLNELRRQFHNMDKTGPAHGDEILISDERSGVRPMQMLEEKIGAALMREQDRHEARSMNRRFE